MSSLRQILAEKMENIYHEGLFETPCMEENLDSAPV